LIGAISRYITASRLSPVIFTTSDEIEKFLPASSGRNVIVCGYKEIALMNKYSVMGSYLRIV
jgi:hypothetical protein